MKIKELFRVGSPSQAVDGATVFLDHTNCQIQNKTRQENAVILHLRREFDGKEGRAYLRVREEYRPLKGQLLSWVFGQEYVLGLTLNDLRDLETGLSVVSVGGRMMLEKGRVG